jgi:hypothetical protein
MVDLSMSVEWPLMLGTNRDAQEFHLRVTPCADFKKVGLSSLGCELASCPVLAKTRLELFGELIAAVSNSNWDRLEGARIMNKAIVELLARMPSSRRR